MDNIYVTVPGTVLPDWIDFNGHMNVGYYGVAMDQASDKFFEHLGIGATYRTATNNSFFTVESHLTYQAELLEGEAYNVVHRLIDCGPKAVHFFGAMYKLDGTLAATAEWMHLHMDMSTRKVAALSEATENHLNAVLNQHSQQPVPLEVGRIMGIRGS